MLNFTIILLPSVLIELIEFSKSTFSSELFVRFWEGVSSGVSTFFPRIFGEISSIDITICFLFIV